MASDHIDAILTQWQRELPALDHSPTGVIGRITRLAQLLDRELEPVFAEHCLSGGEFAVLAALRRAGAPFQLAPAELARSLMVTSGGMTKRLATLHRRGLISRDPAADDRRSLRVTLTAAGKDLVEAVMAEHLANEKRLLAALDTTHRCDLARLLRDFAIVLGDRPARRIMVTNKPQQTETP
jgi:DNA-binding MarR family transcriptional regulator